MPTPAPPSDLSFTPVLGEIMCWPHPCLTLITHPLNAFWQGQSISFQGVFLDGHLPARCTLPFFLGSGSTGSAFASGGRLWGCRAQWGLWSQSVPANVMLTFLLSPILFPLQPCRERVLLSFPFILRLLRLRLSE